MKFQMLSIGDRFEFDGKEYVKTGPLTAENEGRQRMIPRFAVLKPVDLPVKQARKTDRKLDEAVVLDAFDAFVQDCTSLLQATGADKSHTQAWHSALNSARDRFLAELAKSVGEHP